VISKRPCKRCGQQIEVVKDFDGKPVGLDIEPVQGLYIMGLQTGVPMSVQEAKCYRVNHETTCAKKDEVRK
jgi:hypothetical protein